MKPYIKLDTGEMGYELTDDISIDTDGSMNMKVGDDMVIDIETGEPHFVMPFPGSEEEGN